ncbi:MAG: hypothetical protein R2940_09095 [Syntrophotaleaceae bacterium]
MKATLPCLLLVLVSTLTFSPGELLAENGDTSTGEIEITPFLGAAFVDGDDNKFREDWGEQEGLKGGVDQFHLQRDLPKNRRLTVKGRAVVPEQEYLFDLLIERPEDGYIHAGYSEYRKYFDDTGHVFEPFSISSFDLNRDLELDIGRAFIEVGVTIPDLPQIEVGYEHRFKDGEKSLLQWGSVTEGGVTRKIFPSYKNVDEELNIIRMNVSHEIAGVRLGDEFRYEHYRLDNTIHEQERNLDTDADETVTVDEDYEHDAFFNTFHADTHLNDTTYLSLGYLFTTLDGDASFNMATVPFGPEPFDKNWFSRSIDLEQDVHIVNANAVLGPYRDLTIYLGLEGESLDREGDTDAVLTEIAFGGAFAEPEAVIDSDEDKWGLEETVGIRYTGLPRTTLYAEGRWTQQDIDLQETEVEDGLLILNRETDTRVRRQRYSIGFHTSPFDRTTVAARYRRSYRSNDYDHEVDIEEGYSAFITDQDLKTDEVMVKASFRPLNNLRTTLQYQLVSTDIDTDEDTDPPSSIHSGNYDAHIYTASLTSTPVASFFLTGLVSYQDVRLKTIGTGPVETYEGDVLSVSANAGWAVNASTRLDARYIYTLAENFDDFFDEGLPLGTDNQRHAAIADLSHQLTDALAVRLRYGFYSYDDDAGDGSDDYTANLVAAALTMRF